MFSNAQYGRKMAVGYKIADQDGAHSLGNTFRSSGSVVIAFASGTFDPVTPTVNHNVIGVDGAAVSSVTWPANNGFARTNTIGIGAVWSDIVLGGQIPGTISADASGTFVRAFSLAGGWAGQSVDHTTGTGGVIGASFGVQGTA